MIAAGRGRGDRSDKRRDGEAEHGGRWWWWWRGVLVLTDYSVQTDEQMGDQVAEH